MEKSSKRNSFLCVLAAFIWGISFVSQSEGGDALGPLTFNCIRSYIGSAVLLPVIYFLDRAGAGRKPVTKTDKRNLTVGGICCGIILTVASNLQQLGITMGTSVGKAGFLTACYIILVPLIGLFFKKKCGFKVWAGVVLTVIGLYMLCMNESLTIQFSDILVMLCALVFAFHILAVDHFSPLVDGVRMSCIQFFTCAVLTTIPMLVTETGIFTGSGALWIAGFGSKTAWVALLYSGVMSCGVAYTLQIVGQKNVNPTIASLIFSLESVFSALAGWALLGQVLSLRELLGCILIFVAIVLAQI